MLDTISRSPIEIFGDMVYFAVLQKLNAQQMVRELERSTETNKAGEIVCGACNSGNTSN